MTLDHDATRSLQLGPALTIGKAGVLLLAVGRNRLRVHTFPGQIPQSSPHAAVKPEASDAVLYRSGNGNDSNDGFSWGTAKLTACGAISVAPSAGADIYQGATASA